VEHLNVSGLSYCCLGVACHVEGRSYTTLDGGGFFFKGHGYLQGAPPDKWFARTYGITPTQAELLTAKCTVLNDVDSLSFERIAHWLDHLVWPVLDSGSELPLEPPSHFE
jgi:hypothetical protein